MPEQRPHPTSPRSREGSPSAGPSRPTPRRSANRHYLAVVADEARRLAGQLRSPRLLQQTHPKIDQAAGHADCRAGLDAEVDGSPASPQCGDEPLRRRVRPLFSSQFCFGMNWVRRQADGAARRRLPVARRVPASMRPVAIALATERQPPHRRPHRSDGRQGAVVSAAVEIRRCGSLQLRP